MEWLHRHRGSIRLIALALPVATSGGLYLMRGLVSSSAAALVLVLLVVGAAATGDRVSGIAAAVAATVGFDYFLTSPYLDLHIANAEDIELAVLLLLVGLAVNELALWGLRQHAAASQRAGFIEGVLDSADLAVGGAPMDEATAIVAEHIRSTLGVERVDFVHGDPDAGSAVVQRDGSVDCQGQRLNIRVYGLPIFRHTVVPVQRGSVLFGHFRITTATEIVRPQPEQLRVAVLLAEQLERGNRATRNTSWTRDAAEPG